LIAMTLPFESPDTLKFATDPNTHVTVRESILAHSISASEIFRVARVYVTSESQPASASDRDSATAENIARMAYASPPSGRPGSV
jgi:hypothetical protein